MPLDNIQRGIQDWLESQAGENAATTTVGSIFCQWCLENIFDLSEDAAIDAMEVSGSYDHSIDAFIEYGEEINIVQTKFENAHDYSEITKFHYEMQRIKNNKVRETEVNDSAQRLISRILDAYEKKWSIRYFYITNSCFTDVEKSKIERIDGVNTEFFFLDLLEITQRLEGKVQDIPDSISGKWFNLRLSTREILKFADTTAVIAVSLSTIHDFVSQGSDDLFASNVRQYLRGTKINSGIRATIQDSPERFWLYNNGITIVCDDFIEENFSLKIKSPQIVNGCQTAKSIWEILSKKRQQERNALPGHVLVRLIKGANETEKQNITRYTNTQNAVRGKDFFSLEQFHRKLQKRFKKRGYYYEIQRGSFTALKPSERNSYSGLEQLKYLVHNKFKNLVPSLEALQAFAAGFKQYPAIAYGHPYQLTLNGTWYDRVIDDRLEADVRLFLYPYLVREWAKTTVTVAARKAVGEHTQRSFSYTYIL